VLYLGETPGSADPALPLRYTVAIARGNFTDAEKKLEPLRQWLAEELLIEPPEFKATAHPNSSIMKYQTRAPMQTRETTTIELNFAFPTPNLMVFAGTNDLLNSTLDVMTGAAGGLGQDEFWRKMLDRTDITTSMWGAGNLELPREHLQALSAMVPATADLALAKQFYYHFDLGQEFKAEVGFICPTIDDAAKFANAAKASLGMVSAILQRALPTAPLTAQLPSKLWILPELETCKVSLKLQAEERRALLNEWQRLAEQPALKPLAPGAPAPAAPPVPAPAG
jgi:hypothetical protein